MTATIIKGNFTKEIGVSIQKITLWDFFDIFATHESKGLKVKIITSNMNRLGECP